jgi:hypothetical protein
MLKDLFSMIEISDRLVFMRSKRIIRDCVKPH